MKAMGSAGLILLNIVLHSFAQVGFKLSALSTTLKGFLTWQAVGNVSGFLGVLALTLAMRFMPLSQALALSWGLGFVAVQIAGAHFIFREAITLLQWLGVVLVSAGIMLISLGRAS